MLPILNQLQITSFFLHNQHYEKLRKVICNVITCRKLPLLELFEQRAGPRQHDFLGTLDLYLKYRFYSERKTLEKLAADKNHAAVASEERRVKEVILNRLHIAEMKIYFLAPTQTKRLQLILGSCEAQFYQCFFVNCSKRCFTCMTPRLVSLA